MLPFSILIHAALWVYLVLIERNIHPNLIGATYGKISPSVLYLLIIVIGHGACYYLARRSNRAVLALLIFMVYSSLVLLITLLRLQNIDYVIS